MAKAQPGSTQLSQTRKASEVHPLLKYCSDKKKKKKRKTAIPMKSEIYILTYRSRIKKQLYPHPCCSKGRIWLAPDAESFLQKMSKSEPRAPSAGAPTAA